MSVKSTVHLTRDEAEARWRDLAYRHLRPEKMTDKELEDSLMKLNDQDKGGEGFENYRIKDRP